MTQVTEFLFVVVVFSLNTKGKIRLTKGKKSCDLYVNYF